MKTLALIAIVTVCALGGCKTPTPPEKDRLTTGQVQLKLHKDQTTQTEVLEAFGAPNLVSISSEGEEVWTYQRNALLVEAAVGGFPRSKGSIEQSNRTITLIIKFREINGTKRVASFNSRSSSF